MKRLYRTFPHDAMFTLETFETPADLWGRLAERVYMERTNECLV